MAGRKRFVSNIFVGRKVAREGGRKRERESHDRSKWKKLEVTWPIVREGSESNTFQRVYPTVNQWLVRSPGCCTDLSKSRIYRDIRSWRATGIAVYIIECGNQCNPKKKGNTKGDKFNFRDIIYKCLLLYALWFLSIFERMYFDSRNSNLIKI